MLPERPAGHVAHVEEVVGRAADLRVPLLTRVEANPLRTQAREPARHRRCHDLERPDRRAVDRCDGGDRPGLISEAQTGDREHEHEGHESESLTHASTPCFNLYVVVPRSAIGPWSNNPVSRGPPDAPNPSDIF